METPLEKRFQYAWYGSCEVNEPCKPYIFKDDLTILKQKVELISTFTTNNGTNSVLSYNPDTEQGELTQLTVEQCMLSH